MTYVLKFVVLGRIPSKKNSTRNFGYTRLPSKRFYEWQESAAYQLIKHKGILIKGVTRIQMDFYFPDNRKCDLDNKSSSVLDMLQKATILIDDNWQYTGSIFLNPCGIAKKNPRVEIFIEAKNDRD